MTKRLIGDPAASRAAATKALRNAASLLVVRDGPAGLEVLMLQRTEREGDLYSGACVFPGGVIEDGDHGIYEFCHGLADSVASGSLGVSEHGLGYFVAAIRECFEEAGLLFAYGADGMLLDLDGGELTGLSTLRGSLNGGATSFAAVCRELRLELAVDRLAYHSHWLTPPGLPKRFDTRFFLAMAPAAQTVVHDGSEAVAHFWLRPTEALARAREFKLRPATIRTLKTLLPFASAASCYENAQALRDIELMMPRRARAASGPHTLVPGDAAYAEVARLDPDGRGDVSCEIEYDRPLRLSPRVIRLTAPNGNVMTGPGTNTYLVGGGRLNEWAVIDPGPLMPAHVQRILAAAPGRIRTILVTHTHQDHSPAAALLQSLTGAQILGLPAPSLEWPNSALQLDRRLSHGERIAVGDAATLRVIHTPGHASNHLCYLLEEEKTLFTGDHVMQGSSVVITPPDGNMRAYLDALQALLQEDLQWLAPGHGHLLDQPAKVLQRTMAHRLIREEKILGIVARRAPIDVDTLLLDVYDDVSPRLHPMARRSLVAHLEKLLHDGRAFEREGRWQLPAGLP